MKSGLLRFAFAGIAVLLAATIATAWLVPPLLDWNRYRADIAALVSANLGRPVTIEGPISLELLPEPILTAGRVSLERGGADDLGLSVAELRVRLALGPLLSGRVDARELVLRGLDVHLPWPLAPDTLDLRAPLWLAQVAARVEDGRLSVGSATASKINADLGITADTGSYALGGTAQIAGQSWHISARLTRSGGDGTAGLDLSFDGQGPVLGLGAMFSGQIAADGGLSGRISGSGPDLSRLIAAPPVPFKADGRLSVAAGLAVADELALEIAGSPARGAVSLRLAPALRLDVSLAASRIDLDSWLPALLRGGSGRVVAPIPTGIDLSAEAASLSGGTLRGLRGSFELEPDSVLLHDFAAVLPGDAALALNGQVHRTGPAGRPDAALHFEGAAALTAPNLRTTIGWLDTAGLAPLSNLPSGVLRTADLRAEIQADTGTSPQILLTELNGMVDAGHLQGGLIVHPAARLAIAGALTIDKLDLDPWLSTDWPALTGLPGRLGRFDLDLQMRAEQASLRGQTLAPATLDAALEQGRLVIRRLDLQAAGARLVVSGAITDAGRISDGRLDVATAADEARPLITSLAPQLTTLAQRLPRGPLTANLLLSGPPETLGIRAAIDVGDLHVEAQPLLDLPGARWSSSLTLRHPGAPRLLDAVGIRDTVSWLGDGSLSWVGAVYGTGPIWAPNRVATDAFDLTAGSLRATGALALDRTGKPRLTGHISAETLPLPLPYPRAPDPLPTGLLTGWQAALKIDADQVLAGLSPVLQKATANVSIADGVLRLDAASALLEGGALSGAASLDAAAAPPALKLEMALAGAKPSGALFDLPLDLAGGTIDAQTALTATGYSPGTMLATLSGSLRITARDGNLLGVDLPRALPKLADADLRAAFAGGITPYDRFAVTADIRNGALTLKSSEISAPSGTAVLSGLLDIPGRTTELRLAVRPAVPDPPALALRLSGALAAPSRAPEIAEAGRWRVEHP